MNRRLVTTGFCVLTIAIFAAPSANAQEAFTCVKGGGKLDFGAGDSHCSKGHVAEKTGEYGHVSFTGSTSVSGTNETTGGAKDTVKLSWNVAGVLIEFQSTEQTTAGMMENGSGSAHGTGVVTYRHVTVTRPAGKGCKVQGKNGVSEQIVTETISATTAGLMNELKFTPSGEKFAEFTLEGCSLSVLNHTYTITGSVKGQTSGATTTFTKVNTEAQGTLFVFGQVAGIEQAFTIKGSNGNGLSLT
jgi:hypothetical protein